MRRDGTHMLLGLVNIPDTIDDARRAFEIAGRGCLVRMGEDEPRYATVAVARRDQSHALGFLLNPGP